MKIDYNLIEIYFSKNATEDSAAEFLSTAVMLQELRIVQPDFHTWNQKQLDEDGVEKENRFCDKMLLATANHQYLTVS